jgi:hypothetical protein
MACEQPAPTCSVARGDFAATYTLVKGEGDCAGLVGEILSVQTYNPPISKKDKRPDPDRTIIGIAPQGLNDLLWYTVVDPNPEDEQFSLGEISHAEPKKDFCTAPSFSTARLRSPETDDEVLDECTTVPGNPETDIQYKFKNARVYVTAANYGTQFTADLTYIQDGCTAEYKVAALFPAVFCGREIPFEGEPPEQSEEEIMCEVPPPTGTGEFVPDDSLCDPEADPEEGREFGSGISPDFATVCDPVTLHCMLKSKAPSLR